MPEIASVKRSSRIETVSEPEYGLIESRPPVGAPESGVTVNGVAGVEETPALLTALTDCAPLPLLVASNVTSTLFPVCAVLRKPPSAVNE